MDLIELLENHPVIAALHNSNDAKDAIESNSKVVFILSGRIIDIEENVRVLKAKGKSVFVHIDLLEGLGKDIYGIEYLKKKIKPHGLVSTRGALIKHAKDMGLVTVQRLFLLDSRAIDSGTGMIKACEPDFVEVMPGIIPRAIEEFKKRVKQPIIAGGMITDKNDVIMAIKAGALAVSTSRKELWQIS